jgi:hypothetical protein
MGIARYGSQALSVFSSKPLQIALVVGALLFFVYWQGKKAEKEKDLFNNPYPEPGGAVPTNWNATPLANDLHNVLDGLFTSAYEKERVFAKVAILTNNQLTELYNTFNKLFYEKSQETMTEWIANEYNYALSSDRNKILSTLRSLNLR